MATAQHCCEYEEIQEMVSSVYWNQIDLFSQLIPVSLLFHSSAYPFKKNERIIAFFDNFENYLDEDAMWQISENIKPRVTRKTVSQA